MGNAHKKYYLCVMDSIELFSMALGLSSPWYVSKADFIIGANGGKELHLWISFRRGYSFTVNNVTGRAYDTIEKSWRHLNFFEHVCYIHAGVPRIKVSAHEVKMVDVPWARKHSGFTLLFEAYSMLLIEGEMPVSSVSKRVHETAPRVWRIFRYWVSKAVRKIDLKDVHHIGVDETSRCKGHDYITQFMDLDTKRTIFVTQGKDSITFKRFKAWLVAQGGKEDNIQSISMDMSRAFITGARSCFPKADIIFDKFHIFKALNEAVDKVRRLEHRETKLLKGHRFTLLYNQRNLSMKKKLELETLLLTYPTIGKAYGFKEAFADIFDNITKTSSRKLSRWCKLVEDSAIKPMVDFVGSIRTHLFGIKTMFQQANINNGILEGMNAKIQLAKRRARGFYNIDNFKYMIYFIAGKLEMDYPHETL